MTDAALPIAVPLVAEFERFVPAPYHGVADRSGVFSIGYGFTRLSDGSPVSADTPAMIRAEADERLGELLAALLVSIRRIVRVRITDHMAAALASFAYNTGFPALEHSTLLMRLNAGSPTRAAECFLSWVYANGVVVPGLVRRRAAEKALFLTGNGASDPGATEPDNPPVSSTDALNAAELQTINPEPEQAP